MRTLGQRHAGDSRRGDGFLRPEIRSRYNRPQMGRGSPYVRIAKDGLSVADFVDLFSGQAVDWPMSAPMKDTTRHRRAHNGDVTS